MAALSVSDPGPTIAAVASGVIVAAGGSTRMGFDKLTAQLGGRPVVAHSIAAFAAAVSIGELVVVVHPARTDEFRAWVGPFAGARPVRVVPGGAHRQDSVRNGLAAVGPEFGMVAVHDGARPLVTPAQIDACVVAGLRFGAVSLAAPVVETLQRADSEGRIQELVDRGDLWAMQTPQVFRRDLLVRALATAEREARPFTDETAAVRHLGETVRVVENREWNPKITFPRDLELAEVWLGRAVR